MDAPLNIPPELQPLIEHEMARGGFATHGDLLRRALEFWREHHDTRAALEEAVAEADAGLGRSWEEVDRAFRERNGLPLTS